MSNYRRAFALTADESGNALSQTQIGIVEVIAVTWDAGDVGEATLEVSEADAPFLTVDVPGTYRPSVALCDDLGVDSGAVAQPFTLSGQILFGLSNGTPGGTGTATLTYRR